MSDCALVLIDLENEWINPDSEAYIGSDLSEIVNKTNKIIAYCRKRGFKIIFVRHVESDSRGDDSWSETSENTEIISSINKQENDVLITKNKISAFYNTDLDKELEGVKHIFVSGILTNLCVRSFVHDAYDRDYEITIVSDCCATYDDETQSFTIDDLKKTRPELIITSSEKLINLD